jgi:hypothetical protein
MERSNMPSFKTALQIWWAISWRTFLIGIIPYAIISWGLLSLAGLVSFEVFSSILNLAGFLLFSYIHIRVIQHVFKTDFKTFKLTVVSHSD